MTELSLIFSLLSSAGILLIARTRKSAQNLMNFFKLNKTKKVYYAIVEGRVKSKFGEIKMNIRKSTDRKFERMVEDIEGKKSISHYKVLDSNEFASLLELKPLTGRMHQLRIHCSTMGNPIIGDKK